MKNFITGLFKILFIIIISLGGFIFPILYLFDIDWLNILCIMYAVLYAFASIFSGKFISYIIVYVIISLFLMFQYYDNILLTAFIEAPFIINIYALLTACFFKKRI